MMYAMYKEYLDVAYKGEDATPLDSGGGLLIGASGTKDETTEKTCSGVVRCF